MQLSDDATNCEDIDECELNSPCSHICQNIEKRFAVENKIKFSSSSLFKNFRFTVSSANVLRVLCSMTTGKVAAARADCFCHPIENRVLVPIPVQLITAGVVSFVSSTRIASFVRVEMASRLIQTTGRCALISMNANGTARKKTHEKLF